MKIFGKQCVAAFILLQTSFSLPGISFAPSADRPLPAPGSTTPVDSALPDPFAQPVPAQPSPVIPDAASGATGGSGPAAPAENLESLYVRAAKARCPRAYEVVKLLDQGEAYTVKVPDTLNMTFLSRALFPAPGVPGDAQLLDGMREEQRQKACATIGTLCHPYDLEGFHNGENCERCNLICVVDARDAVACQW